MTNLLQSSCTMLSKLSSDKKYNIITSTLKHFISYITNFLTTTLDQNYWVKQSTAHNVWTLSRIVRRSAHFITQVVTCLFK